MVAGDRTGHNSRHPEQDEIILGTWQIALGRAIRAHYQNKVPTPANSAIAQSDAG